MEKLAVTRLIIEQAQKMKEFYNNNLPLIKILEAKKPIKITSLMYKKEIVNYRNNWLK